MTDYEQRLPCFYRSLAKMRLDGKAVGYAYFEVDFWTFSSPTAGADAYFEAPALEFDVHYLDHASEMWDGVIYGATALEHERLSVEVLSELESSRFLFRGIRYDLEWVSDPVEFSTLLPIFR